jgi:phage terminase large subunit-like protein
MGRSRPSIAAVYGKKESMSDYSDAELRQYQSKYGGLEDSDIERYGVERELKATEKKMAEELKTKKAEQEKELAGAASLSALGMQRRKRFETSGRAATMKPIINSGGIPIPQDPKRKTLVGA